MNVSPFCISGSSLAMVWSTGSPEGTMIQMARGAERFFTRSSRDETPREPASVSFFTASALKSNPTTLWPARRRRSAILPPIFPRPMMPSSIKSSQSSESAKRLSSRTEHSGVRKTFTSPFYAKTSSVLSLRPLQQAQVHQFQLQFLCAFIHNPVHPDIFRRLHVCRPIINKSHLFRFSLQYVTGQPEHPRIRLAKTYVARAEKQIKVIC